MRSTTAPGRGASKAPGPARKQYVRVKCEPDVAARLKALAAANGFSMGEQINQLMGRAASRRRSASTPLGR